MLKYISLYTLLFAAQAITAQSPTATPSISPTPTATPTASIDPNAPANATTPGVSQDSWGNWIAASVDYTSEHTLYPLEQSKALGAWVAERPWQTSTSTWRTANKNLLTSWIIPTWTPPPSLEKPVDLGSNEIYIIPIEVNYDLDSVYQIDGVELVTGYSLDAKSEYFGEFSGMALSKTKNNSNQDAFKVTAVSDMGNYWECILDLDSNNHELLGFSDNRVGSLKGLGVKERDIEGLAILQKPDGSLTYFVSHELDGKKGEVGPNQISVYKDSFEDKNNRTAYKLQDIQNCKYNKGIEAIGLHPTLGAILIHESDDGAGNNLHALHQWKDMDFGTPDAPKTATASSFYKSTEGYEVSDVTFLSDGTMLVLERLCQPRWHGMAEDYQVIVRAVPSTILTDALSNPSSNTPVEGKQMIYIDKVAPGGVLLPLGDNFECISAIEWPADSTGNKEISIFLLTDDNRAPFQRTIMLQFKTESATLKDAMDKAFPAQP